MTQNMNKSLVCSLYEVRIEIRKWNNKTKEQSRGSALKKLFRKHFLWNNFFSVKIAKFFRISIQWNTWKWVLLKEATTGGVL